MRSPGRGFISCFLLPAVFLTGSGTHILHAQKRVSKTLINPEIKAISIDSDLCYRVILETTDTDEVTVEARMDGEYSGDLVIHFREDGQTLFIEPRFGPEFRLPNDKLGAHKVVSVGMRVALPEDQNVQVTATTCDIRTSGRFRDLKIVFNDGSCRLEHRAEHTEVRTGSASILARIHAGSVEAESRFGLVSLEPVPAGDHHLKLFSARGNISVQRCR